MLFDDINIIWMNGAIGQPAAIPIKIPLPGALRCAARTPAVFGYRPCTKIQICGTLVFYWPGLKPE